MRADEQICLVEWGKEKYGGGSGYKGGYLASFPAMSAFCIGTWILFDITCIATIGTLVTDGNAIYRVN